MKIPMYPRDSAGSFTLPPGTVGNITEMCALTSFMEIYTPGETFKIQTPETIDPKRTNAKAMWVMVRTHSVGSASPFVARTLLMASKSANLLSPLSGEKALLERMHGIKETLLQVQAAARALIESTTIEAEVAAANGFRLAPNGTSLEKFPWVPELDAKVAVFLTTARRAITEICQIPNHFLKLNRQHSSLEHLSSKELALKFGTQQLEYIDNFIAGTKHLIELRDGLEHRATTTKKLNVRNFEHMPDNQLRRPTWFLDGEEADDIGQHTRAVPGFLLSLAEAMFVACADATLPDWPPVLLEEIKPVDTECPIRYRAVIDQSRLIFPAE
jgi:hypothetical protein